MSDEKKQSPESTSHPGDIEQASLGDQATFAGGFQQRDTQQSLGDQPTFGDQSSGIDDAFDSHMEVVDLEARYKVEGVLGKGGMGEVLLALDTRLERKVAIKRILGNASRSKTAVNRFLTEAKSIAALNHPNIVQIYDYGRAKDGPFLIMEFVEGNSLLDRCRDGALPLEEAVEITCQLCDGLGKAHAAGIIHRDIKPANVLMTKDGVPKLTDFGLAKAEAADTGMTMAGAVLGTLDFMPPEQRRDAALTDARSDLWSLAASLYQMVTGKSPKIIKFNDVPKALQDVLGKALEDAKEDRYQAASEMREALKASLKQSAVAIELPQDLNAGECPKCQARNDSSRRFCSGCGDSLRVSCLGCEKEIPVWEKFCAECGANQGELISARLSALKEQCSRAEQLREQYAYGPAIQIAEEVISITDRRISQFVPWGTEFIESTRVEQERETAKAQEHFAESKKHREVFDYPSAIHAMESIPGPMRLPEVQAFLTSLRLDQEESAELLRAIKSRINERSIEGLLPLVERAIELRGDREDLRKLRSQLTERENKLNRERDEAYLLAESLFSGGKAKEAFQAVQALAASRLNQQQLSFRKRLEVIVSAEEELVSLVKEAKADGVIDDDELIAIYSKTVEYLDLNPNHASILKMRDDLLNRMKKIPRTQLSKLPSQILEKLPPKVIGLVENSIGMRLQLIFPGTFLMGEDEESHPVTLTQPFYLGIYQVTQEQYERVVSENPSSFEGPQNPVDSVSWEDAVSFCEKLSSLPEERAAGRVYRLPTEAEWEYACRAGSTTTYCFGDDEAELGDYAWYRGNSGSGTHPVGQRKPNALGLYDMHGNVFEWCQDWDADYPSGSVVDPAGPSSGSHRVYRGGSWRSTAEGCRSAFRCRRPPRPRLRHLFGFRVACVLSGQ